MPRTVEVILNAGSGSTGDETADTLTELFKQHEIDARIPHADEGVELDELIRKAVESDSEVMVGCGGDGTISAVAAQAAESGKTLGILPLGTLNHFSKDLGIPRTLPEAVEVIAENHTQNVDLGEVNGRVFINNSSIGLYPRIVRHREAQQERLGRGKWSAAFVAALKVFRRDPFIKVKFKFDGREFTRKTPFVFIGNNEYAMDAYNIGTRERLDAGKLSVYFLHRGGRWGVLLLVLKTAFGMLRQARDFEAVCTDEITIATRKSSVMVALDGEVGLMQSPLEYKIRPGALRVIVPRPEDEQNA